MFVDNITWANESLKQQAYDKCEGDVSCLFDAASTKDLNVGLSTKQLGSQLVNDSQKMSEFVLSQKRNVWLLRQQLEMIISWVQY